MEFMEGDTASGMFALWWKEICDSNHDSSCWPEKTCGGSTGEPITGDYRTDYFPDSDYTFDNEGCYYDSVTNPPVDFYCIKADCTKKADAMIKIRRLWQFPYYSVTTTLPSDVYNREAQVIYTSSDPLIEANYGWMLGDVVPMNTCAYVVSYSTEIDYNGDLVIYHNYE